MGVGGGALRRRGRWVGWDPGSPSRMRGEEGGSPNHPPWERGSFSGRPIRGWGGGAPSKEHGPKCSRPGWVEPDESCRAIGQGGKIMGGKNAKKKENRKKSGFEALTSPNILWEKGRGKTPCGAPNQAEAKSGPEQPSGPATGWDGAAPAWRRAGGTAPREPPPGPMPPQAAGAAYQRGEG